MEEQTPPEVTTTPATQPTDITQAPIETLPPKPFYKNKFFLGFVGISILAAFLIGGFALGSTQ